jgi:hypothetical protein
MQATNGSPKDAVTILAFFFETHHAPPSRSSKIGSASNPQLGSDSLKLRVPEPLLDLLPHYQNTSPHIAERVAQIHWSVMVEVGSRNRDLKPSLLAENRFESAGLSLVTSLL